MQITYLVRFVLVDFNMIYMIKFEKKVIIIIMILPAGGARGALAVVGPCI